MQTVSFNRASTDSQPKHFAHGGLPSDQGRCLLRSPKRLLVNSPFTPEQRAR